LFYYWLLFVWPPFVKPDVLSKTYLDQDKMLLKENLWLDLLAEKLKKKKKKEKKKRKMLNLFLSFHQLKIKLPTPKKLNLPFLVKLNKVTLFKSPKWMFQPKSRHLMNKILKFFMEDLFLLSSTNILFHSSKMKMLTHWSPLWMLELLLFPLLLKILKNTIVSNWTNLPVLT